MTRVRVLKHPKYTTIKKTIYMFNKRILGLIFVLFFAGNDVFLKTISEKIVSIFT